MNVTRNGSNARLSSFAIRHSLLLFALGCTPVETRFDILSFKDQRQQDLYSERFPPGAFAVTAHRNTTFVFEIQPQRPLDSFDNPKSPENSTAPVGQRDETAQILRLEVFWMPRPGTTYADSSQTDAHVAYCLINGPHAVTYEGAGFVYFTRSRDGRTITGSLESSTLVPVYFAGEPFDLFGPCHVKGEFTAHEDRSKVVAAELRLKRYATTTTQPAQP